MKMKKILLPIAATLLSGAALASQIILIDFGSAGGAGGMGWNTLANASATGTSTFNLDDTNNDSSGLSVGPFTAAGVDGAGTNLNVTTTGGPVNLQSTHIPTWANANAINDHFLLTGSSATGGFAITGLQAGWTYNVNLAVFADNSDRFATYNFDVYDAVDESYRNVGLFAGINSRYNVSLGNLGNDLYVTFTALSNETTLRVLATTGSGSGDRAAFNAMQIVAIPEPSTILLSLLALGTAVLLRRRK
ncbi:MAG: PEP-CTERM sorting domain-containing protein [Verrucomicrobia bacterium]|nr:PEP-CTERM sorting domain-containing protein [Verrucomicrobiota bacterium]MCH8527423.1 PEP-CTERM sorting domain-containing protein [Kiritimatiellia bacterium]